MKDDKTTIMHLKNIVRDFVHERDWEQFHSAKNLSMDISIEAAELMELFLWDNDSYEKIKQDNKRMERIKEELADIIITTLNLGDRLDIDIVEAVEKKIEINKAKYSVEKARGISKKYTEL